MQNKIILLIIAILAPVSLFAQQTNPVIYADVPDMSLVRAGDTYCMGSTLFFDDDGKIYMIYGVKKLHIVELKEDLSGSR